MAITFLTNEDREELLAKIKEAASSGGGLERVTVDVLPTTGIKVDTVYLVPSAESETNNQYDEYVFIPNEGATADEDGTYSEADGVWEVFGGGSSRSGEYVTQEQFTQLEEAIDELKANGTGSSIEPAEDDIPKVFFGGALQQTKDEAVVPFRYISKTQDISGYAEIKAQGNSSMNYAKKNQTVKLFKDAGCTEKLKVDFKEWGKQNKHVYKANWIDLSHARNVVSARLWGDVVKSRADYEELPELFRTTPNQGAVDGFPVKVYAAGVYQGRYTLNIPKDKWTFNMDDELENHCVLCGENYKSGCFRAAAEINGSDWTDEIHDVVPASIKTRWNEVISFVMNSTDEEFKANLGNYFYIDSLIDYYLFGLASCGLDAFGKNQIYATYDGQRWIASMYDMDSTWGLYWNGSKFVATDYARTSYEDFVSTTATGEGNLLYIRLEQLFGAELQARWAKLKNGALSIDNIINRFERFTDIAPAELVAEDYASTTGGGSFTGIPSKTTNNIQQIRAYAVARQLWTDEYINALGEPEEPTVTLSSISATYTGGDVDVGTSVDSLTGIIVTATYSDGSTATVTDYTLSGTIAEGSNTITVTYEDKTTTFTVIGIAEEQITLTSIAATYSGGDVVEGTALSALTGITVTGIFSDGSTSEITGYELSGEIVEGSNTITVTYSGLTTTFTVTGLSSEIPCTGIALNVSEMEFTDENTQTLAATVTPSDTTDTIVWSSDDETIATVEGGVVTAVGDGSCTITATCGSYSASCSVTVTLPVSERILYRLPEATTFDGVDDYIDTGVQLFDENKPFTVLVDWTHTTANFIHSNHCVLHCIYESTGYQGITVQYADAGLEYVLKQNVQIKTGSSYDDIAKENISNVKVAFTKTENGAMSITRRYNKTGDVFRNTANGTFYQINQNVLLGCYQKTDGTKGRFTPGIMNACEIRNYAMTEDEVNAWLMAD